MPDLVRRALAFAAEAHASIDQRRKYTNEPYIAHPIAVAKIVRTVRHTDAMIAAAYLHDVIEDTPVELLEIKSEFGLDVAELVYWLTDASKPEDGNRAARKAIDRERIARAPAAAQTIKLADLIDNTRTISAFDPDFWQVYREEKRQLLGVLRRSDRRLWQQAAEQVGMEV